MTSIGHFGASNDQTLRTRKVFLRNMAVEAVEASEVAETTEVNEAAKVVWPGKSLLQTSIVWFPLIVQFQKSARNVCFMSEKISMN